ncbi:hypothetical protein RND71_012933 [Anisodus tanguticus]|uniref:Uncharacterized protein n=1 Tax=Anisodus tanguticus TaxID=243964 RepID=A0AAE1SI17_9SOLA|nr:hypothetical protein RND71_012933 [Anisodus tanguticus]
MSRESLSPTNALRREIEDEDFLTQFPGLRLTTSLVLPRRPGGNSTGPSTLLPGKSRDVLGGRFSGSVQPINETRSNSPTYGISSYLRGIEPTLSHAGAPYSARGFATGLCPEDKSVGAGTYINHTATFSGPSSSCTRVCHIRINEMFGRSKGHVNLFFVIYNYENDDDEVEKQNLNLLKGGAYITLHQPREDRD